MVKILSSVTLVLMLILLPPATLMFASNNAVPGQMMYPVKRTLETGILLLASLTPTTKAYFAISQTERRFNEAETLLIAGSDASSSLNELVDQTEQAALDINNISSDQEKSKLITELSDSIGQYQISLQTASQTETSINYQPSSEPKPSHMTAYQYASQKNSQNAASSKPPIAQSPPPNQSPHQPVQTQIPVPDNSQLQAILDAQRKLEELKKELERQQQQLQNQLKSEKSGNSTPQTSPPAIPSPSAVASPSSHSSGTQDFQPSSASPLPSASSVVEIKVSPTPVSSPSKNSKSRKSNIDLDDNDQD